MPDFRWCLAGNGCRSGQLHPCGAAEPIFRCEACGGRSCVACDSPFHEGEPCAEYKARVRERRRQELESETLIADTTKLCPGKGCHTKIEKRGGCDHMTCECLLLSDDLRWSLWLRRALTRGPLRLTGSRCGHEFCWKCLASYAKIRRRGNVAHGRNCPDHTSNLRFWPQPAPVDGPDHADDLSEGEVED